MQKKLSVIIVNYNGVKFLKECLDSLADSLSEISHEIIIIDNNSSDNSCNYIAENYPYVKLIASKINYGFGKGNNVAVQQAQGEFLLLINNDTIVLDKLNPVLEKFLSDDKIGIVGIKMLNGNKEYLPSAGVFPNIKNMFQMKKLLTISPEFINGNFSKSDYEVDWLSGSFIVIKKQTYQQINGFDEDFFMYVEDVDFSKRVCNLGLKRVFLTNLSYIHFVGFNKSKNELLVKGYELYLSKHYRGFNKFVITTALKINKVVKRLKNKFNID